MNKSRDQLAARRIGLLATIAEQRQVLTDAFTPLHRTLSLADRVLDGLRYFSRHSLLLAGTVALAVAMRPQRWFVLLENGVLAWRLIQTNRRGIKN